MREIVQNMLENLFFRYSWYFPAKMADDFPFRAAIFCREEKKQGDDDHPLGPLRSLFCGAGGGGGDFCGRSALLGGRALRRVLSLVPAVDNLREIFLRLCKRLVTARGKLLENGSLGWEI